MEISSGWNFFSFGHHDATLRNFFSFGHYDAGAATCRCCDRRPATRQQASRRDAQRILPDETSLPVDPKESFRMKLFLCPAAENPSGWELLLNWTLQRNLTQVKPG